MKNLIIATIAVLASATASAETFDLFNLNHAVVDSRTGTVVVDMREYFVDNCETLIQEAEAAQAQADQDAADMIEVGMY